MTLSEIHLPVELYSALRRAWLDDENPCVEGDFATWLDYELRSRMCVWDASWLHSSGPSHTSHPTRLVSVTVVVPAFYYGIAVAEKRHFSEIIAAVAAQVVAGVSRW